MFVPVLHSFTPVHPCSGSSHVFATTSGPRSRNHFYSRHNRSFRCIRSASTGATTSSARSFIASRYNNKAMLALCREHRLEHRTKHIALRYFLARELQQRGQLRLAYVAFEANTADIFTKALAPGDHQRFCTLLDFPTWMAPSVRESMKLATWSRTAPYVVFAASAVLFAAAVTIRFTNPDLASCTPADMGAGQEASGAQGSDEASRFLISNFGLPGPVPWKWIRKSVQDQFTLDGRVQVKNRFVDADATDSGAKPYVWSTDGIDQQAAMARRRDTGFGSYGPNVTGSFYSAFEKYPLAGKNVLIVGSQWPWVEAICLGFDPHAITTVDFNRPVASHPRLRQLAVGELEGSSETWDAAVSFSSLEHDGLGRYGDPINPNGDLERMKKVGWGSTRWAARGAARWAGALQGGSWRWVERTKKVSA
ncbi:unnamed protein product [Closterium sp. NIES-54]